MMTTPTLINPTHEDTSTRCKMADTENTSMTPPSPFPAAQDEPALILYHGDLDHVTAIVFQ